MEIKIQLGIVTYITQKEDQEYKKQAYKTAIRTGGQKLQKNNDC